MHVVTGATGHIGNVLVRELLSRGVEVRALIPPFDDTTSLEGVAVERVEGDILAPGSLVAAFRGADVVYHLAGMVSILPGQGQRLHRVNVEGTRNVVAACFEAGVPRLVYTSSVHALGVPPPGAVVDEGLGFDPQRAMGDYDRSKALATLEVLDGVGQGLDAVIVCPTGVIGPYDYRVSEMGQLLLDFARGRIRAYIEGAYDFVDVRDVATGHVLAVERGRSGESYILSGERVTVRDLMLLLEGELGVAAPRSRVPTLLARFAAIFTPLYQRLTGQRPLFTEYSIRTLSSDCIVNSEKARRELGYHPRPIRESIIDAIRWFRERGVL